MLKLNPTVLHRLQQLLLFILIWEKFSGTLSLSAGVVLFAVFSIAAALIEILFRRKIPALSEFAAAVMSCLFIILVFPILHLVELLPLGQSAELQLLTFHNLILPVVPVIVLFRFLAVVSTKGRLSNLGVAASYGVFLTILLSRSSWMILLPFGKLIYAYLFIYLFVLIGLLIVLSGGEQGRSLGAVHFLILILVPLLILVPVSRNYSSESKKESGGLLESSLFRFDFSNYLSLESSISMKDDLVFILKSEGREGDFMIRRFILPEYSLEKGFHRVAGPTLESPGRIVDDYLLGEEFRSWDIPRFSLTDQVSQEYYLVNFDSSAFLGMNTPESVTPYQSWDHSSFSRIYGVDSRVSTAWGWDLMDAPVPEEEDEEDREFIAYYTNYGHQEDLRETAEMVIAGVDGYYGKVKAIESYLLDNFYYSLHPGTADDGDQLRHFLYDSKKGYCSYFAFSMALLCRSIGIPARVALGFWVDGSTGVLNYYPVKANQAHAWVEVFFPGFGWMEFDPTSQIPAPGEEYQFAPLSAQEIEPYLREILENREFLKTAESSDAAGPDDDNTNTWSLPGVTTPAGILAEFAILLVALIFYRWLRICSVLKKIPRTAKKTSRYFRFHIRLAEKLLLPREEGESYQEYARRLSLTHPFLNDFVVLYEKIRFGWSSLSDLRTLVSSGNDLRVRIRRGLNGAGKLKYYLILILGRF